MKLRVRGCYGRLDRDHFSPGYLLDDRLLLDGGTINSALSPDEMAPIDWVLLSHPHFDHLKEIPQFLLIKVAARAGLTLAGMAPTIAALREHVFNGTMWLDFTRGGDPPALVYQTLVEGEPAPVGPYTVTAVPVEHTVFCAGMIVERDGVALAYTGDSKGTTRFWRAVAANRNVQTVLIDTAFPDRLAAQGEKNAHYWPARAAADLATVDRPLRVLVTHMQPAHVAEIAADYRKTGLNVELLEQGRTYEI